MGVILSCVHISHVMSLLGNCFWQKQCAPFVMCPLELFAKSLNHILGELAERRS